MPQLTIPRMEKETTDLILSLLADKRVQAKDALLYAIEMGYPTVTEKIDRYKQIFEIYEDFTDYLLEMEEIE